MAFMLQGSNSDVAAQGRISRRSIPCPPIRALPWNRFLEPVPLTLTSIMLGNPVSSEENVSLQVLIKIPAGSALDGCIPRMVLISGTGFTKNQ